jgi:hypothetical protein
VKQAATRSASIAASSVAPGVPAAASGRIATATSVETDPSGPTITCRDEPSST